MVLVQPRKTRPFLTERLLTGRKAANQRKQTNIDTRKSLFVEVYQDSSQKGQYNKTIEFAMV